MLLDASKASLLVIDIQDRLLEGHRRGTEQIVATLEILGRNIQR